MFTWELMANVRPLIRSASEPDVTAGMTVSVVPKCMKWRMKRKKKTPRSKTLEL